MNCNTDSSHEGKKTSLLFNVSWMMAPLQNMSESCASPINAHWTVTYCLIKPNIFIAWLFLIWLLVSLL